jgi:hypothetical protein
MIHYFNPGHEMAVLNASPYYRLPESIRKMQDDLALLPAWYAAPGDYVMLPDDYRSGMPDLTSETVNQEVALWGISPQSVYFFEKLNKQYGLKWKIPEWKTEYRSLGSRLTSQKVLASLMDAVPEIEKTILPDLFSRIEDIEDFVSQTTGRQVLKSPYSSSGRGLVWLPPGSLARSEKQIISGMLKKQSQVSLEKALDNQFDFSMHFEITPKTETRFIGYSVFQTNAKGAYECSLLANQKILEGQITSFISIDLLLEIKSALTGILQKLYAPYYNGNIGVDMLIYRSGGQYKLHPCIEVNMRKSMGYLAIRLMDNHLCVDSQGVFKIEYHSDSLAICQRHSEWQQTDPLFFENGRIQSGYFSLCPVRETSNYHAYAIISH